MEHQISEKITLIVVSDPKVQNVLFNTVQPVNPNII